MNITNRKYWHDRAINTQKRTEKNYLDVMSDLKAIFKQTVKDFDRLIDKWIADIVDSGDQVLLNDLMNSINSSERRNLKESTMDYYFKHLKHMKSMARKCPMIVFVCLESLAINLALIVLPYCKNSTEMK